MSKQSQELKLEDFKFEYQKVSDRQIICFIINRDNIKFGIHINSNMQPPDDWVFNLYMEKGNEFWIDCTITEIVIDKIN